MLQQATNDYEKIKRSYISLYRDLEMNDFTFDKVEITDENLQNEKETFVEAMSNDFNTANAITSIFKMSKIINNLIRDKNASGEIKKQAMQLYKEMLWVLGIEVDITPLTPDEKNIVCKWYEARNNKDFTLADELRKEINERKIVL